MAEVAQKYVSYEDYVALEQRTMRKHEWLDGYVVAMAGGSIAHSALSGNVYLQARLATRGRPCRVFGADFKVRVGDEGLATYPDVSVFCQPLETHPEDRHAGTNPSLVVEVLSPSTEAWDRGGKFQNYQALRSLRDYVLVSQYARSLEHFQRNDDGSWTLRVLGPGDTLVACDGALRIAVDDIYEDVELETQPPIPEHALGIRREP